MGQRSIVMFLFSEGTPKSENSWIDTVHLPVEAPKCLAVIQIKIKAWWKDVGIHRDPILENNGFLNLDLK